MAPRFLRGTRRRWTRLLRTTARSWLGKILELRKPVPETTELYIRTTLHDPKIPKFAIKDSWWSRPLLWCRRPAPVETQLKVPKVRFGWCWNGLDLSLSKITQLTKEARTGLWRKKGRSGFRKSECNQNHRWKYHGSRIVFLLPPWKYSICYLNNKLEAANCGQI